MKNYVVCLKWGNKYSPEYVNRLYNMVSRNCTIPFEFVCVTENSKGITENVKILPLQTKNGVQGWWYKPMFFSSEFPLKGNLLFMDLDVIVFRNIDKLFNYNPGKFCIIRDFPVPRKNIIPINMNSSVFRVQTGQYSFIYDEFINDLSVTKKFHGDQDWIYHKLKDKEYEFWPDSWVRSYKWQMLNTLRINSYKNARNEIFYKSDIELNIDDDTCISVFHGQPNPHNCLDEWVVRNWK